MCVCVFFFLSICYFIIDTIWNQALWTPKQFHGLSQNPVFKKHKLKVTFTGFVHNIVLECEVNNFQNAGIIDMDSYQICKNEWSEEDRRKETWPSSKNNKTPLRLRAVLYQFLKLNLKVKIHKYERGRGF